MTRLLKTSGFLGLATMMGVGLYQNFLIMQGGPANVPPWMVGGHAHLGVLSILAIVMGFAVPALGVTGRLRSAVSGLFVVGQWALPLTVWTASGLEIGPLHATAFLWGACLLVSMLLMAYVAATSEKSSGGGRTAAAPADD
ncbi:hypothetical protein [Haloglomus litoreum]|uniref:hypothetical protein n=1 Tax=Haloglomus litoreum TaxID=3034026 RepID=UPI0023E8C9E7|nr:hypothetical protein [Haloglomus sp. DT116]